MLPFKTLVEYYPIAMDKEHIETKCPVCFQNSSWVLSYCYYEVVNDLLNGQRTFKTLVEYYPIAIILYHYRIVGHFILSKL